jgi:hypothetical protein
MEVSYCLELSWALHALQSLICASSRHVIIYLSVIQVAGCLSHTLVLDRVC